MRNVLVIVAVALVTVLHAAAWFLLKDEVTPPNANGALASVSFAPIQPHKDGEADYVSEEEIRSDLAAIAPHTRMVRTYSAIGGLERVPALASEYGLRVTLGAWLDAGSDRNEREIESAIELTKRYRNIDSVIVGNETIYRNRTLDGDDGVKALIEQIQRVKREVNVPVSTAEVWDIWLDHPELASAVDYLAVHILPYWEGLPADAAVDHAVQIYERLRQAYPGKRIVIAEFGWPSAGLNRNAAVPGRLAQAEIIRDFVARADAMGIDYSIIEAFDQPWKTNEGSVGPYWGIFNADREPKFALAGTVETPNFLFKMLTALGIGLLLSIPIFAMPRATPVQAGVVAATAAAIGAWSANVIDYWVTHYFVLGSQIAMFGGMLLLIPLIMIMRQRIEELAAILFGAKPSRLLTRADAPGYKPFVSIHIPAYREPPEMLRQTLDSVARLDWPDFECVVVVNNTPDPALWMPVEEHCRQLGERFKFVREDRLQGFKAGALRLALEHTDPRTEIVGVLDADYEVTSDWLKDLVPAFADSQVGLVQAPQDHRDGNRCLTQAAMNREYAGFFDIGMVQRNEVDAIVTHGTMCLVRRAALDDAGGWSSDTIVEDSDLGLSLLARGWRAHYTKTRYGYGLLPTDFAAYKKQRHRWAYGGVQLIRKHWRAFMPGGSRLTPQQKGQFLFGWLTWLGAESLGVLIAILNLIWMPLVAFLGIAVPEAVLLLPVLATFAVTLLHFMVLYRARVEAPVGASLGAALSAMALQFTVGRAVLDGVVRDKLPFVRTAKGSASRWAEDFPALWEAVLGGLLLLGSLLLYVTNYNQVREISIFSAVLFVQSLPFLAAVGMALFERSRLNAFATWRRLATLPIYRPRLPRGPAPSAGPQAGGGVGVVP